MGSRYLYHLTFTLFNFILKNFMFFEMVSDTMMSPIIFLLHNEGSHQFLGGSRFRKEPF